MNEEKLRAEYTRRFKVLDWVQFDWFLEKLREGEGGARENGVKEFIELMDIRTNIPDPKLEGVVKAMDEFINNSARNYIFMLKAKYEKKS